MRSATDPEGWFLIDFEDASTIPTRAAHHLDRETHSPRVFVDGHLGEVDMWGVGKLIMAEALRVSAAMIALGERLLSDEPPTAAEAIVLVRRFAILLFIPLSSALIDLIHTVYDFCHISSLGNVMSVYSALRARFKSFVVGACFVGLLYLSMTLVGHPQSSQLSPGLPSSLVLQNLPFQSRLCRSASQTSASSVYFFLCAWCYPWQ